MGFYSFFFFFAGGVWYNVDINASLCKTSQNLQKYLKKRQNWRKKRAKNRNIEKHRKMLKSEVFQNIKKEKSKKKEKSAPILQARPN